MNDAAAAAGRRTRRWTGLGTPAVESLLSECSGEIARVVCERVPASWLVTLAVIGGYGRGEGGVERVGDDLRPHNNIDLLLITRGADKRTQAHLRRDLNRALAPVAERFGVPIDLGVIGARALRNARRHVLWYDLREGHRTIAGESGFLADNVRFEAADIDPRDVRDLVVNRGTLLLINHLALAAADAGRVPDAQARAWRKRIVRHAMKAVVGYGDALLYAAGAYHWSYREKGVRIRRCALVDSALRDAYERAIEFRFQPDYESFSERDLGAWHAELSAMVEPAHRRFLRVIHGRDISWSDYPDACLRHSLSRSSRSARDWVRCLKSAVNTRGRLPVHDMRLRCRYLLASVKDRLAAVFPAACYGQGASHPLVRGVLTQESASASVRDENGDVYRKRRFLDLWAVDGDVNIPDEVRALSHTAELPVETS